MYKSHIERVLTARASADRKVRKFLKAPTGISKEVLSMDTFHDRMVINCETYEEVKAAARSLTAYLDLDDFILEREARAVKIWAGLYLIEFRDPRVDWISVYFKTTRETALATVPGLSEGDFDE